MVKLIEINID